MGLSTEFVLTRSVRDTAAMLDACAVQAPGDPYIAVPPARPFVEEFFAQAGRLRIGIMRCGPRGTPVNAANLVALEQTAKHLESLGHIVEEAYPSALDDAQSIMTYVTIVAVNTARALDRASHLVGQAVTAADVEPLTWALAERARSVTAPQYIETLECLHSFGRGLAAWWEGGMDLLLTPTQAEPPPPHGFLTSTPEEPFRALLRSAPYGAFTLPWNMSGQPAISVPAQFSEEGLPLGVQLVAAYGREDLLLRVASQLEEAAPWAQRQPTLGA